MGSAAHLSSSLPFRRNCIPRVNTEIFDVYMRLRTVSQSFLGERDLIYASTRDLWHPHACKKLVIRREMTVNCVRGVFCLREANNAVRTNRRASSHVQLHFFVKKKKKKEKRGKKFRCPPARCTDATIARSAARRVSRTNVQRFRSPSRALSFSLSLSLSLYISRFSHLSAETPQ